jgi:hypothetical protein
LSRFFLKWSIPSITDDEETFFPTSYLEGFMGQLITSNKLCVACMFEMIQAMKIKKPLVLLHFSRKV